LPKSDRLKIENEPCSEYKHTLTYVYVVIATKPVHRLQICPTVPNKRAPLLFPKLHPSPCSSVVMRRGTHRHTDGCGQYTFRLVYASREIQ